MANRNLTEVWGQNTKQDKKTSALSTRCTSILQWTVREWSYTRASRSEWVLQLWSKQQSYEFITIAGMVVLLGASWENLQFLSANIMKHSSYVLSIRQVYHGESAPHIHTCTCALEEWCWALFRGTHPVHFLGFHSDVWYQPCTSRRAWRDYHLC